MVTTTNESLTVASEQDLVPARQKGKEFCRLAELSITDATKLVTALSELSRNMWLYAQGGTISFALVQDGSRKGVKIILKDEGPGIADLDLAMQEGYSSFNGMGIGLPGSKRLVSDFQIKTEAGKGTEITIVKWNK